MSSFWNLFGKQSADGEPAPEIEPPPAGSGTPSENAAAAAGEAEPLVLTSLKAPTEVKPLLLPKQPYGIDDAIRLMRTLPVDDNVDLVVRVIKKTLESLSVRVPDILDDASKRQDALKNGISERQAAIQQLEREIETRRAEIAHLGEELAETTRVRERLQLAENLPASIPPKFSATPAAPSAARKPDPPRASGAAPPLPTTTFRPKLSSSDMKKGVGPTPEPPTVGAAAPPPSPSPSPNEEVAVESSDVVEKAP